MRRLGRWRDFRAGWNPFLWVRYSELESWQSRPQGLPLAVSGNHRLKARIYYDIEAALGEDLGEGGLPVEGFGMDRLVADDAVALADGVVEAGQLFAARGGLDPEAELADLDGLGAEVYAVEVVLEDLAVEVEEGALARSSSSRALDRS